VFGHWVEVHFDGACEPAPGGGVATYGFVVSGEGFDYEESGLAVPPWTPRATNNVAEYTAAIRALEHLRSAGFTGNVLVVGDSQLVVRQMLGEYEVRAPHLKAYHDHLVELGLRFTEVRWVWVPREENLRADELSKEALARERAPAQGHRPGRPRSEGR
jgi:ribonuclease HI